MKRFAYLAPSVLLALSVAACTDDGTASGDTEAGTDSNGTDGTTSTSSTTADSMTGGSTTDPTTTTSTTGPVECTDADECITATDCGVDQMCIDCICIGEAGCEGDPPTGEYGDCLTDLGTVDISQCAGGPMAGCLVDDTTNPNGGICFFGGCTDTCDCPAAPAGFEDQVECDALTSMTENDCFLSCTDDIPCPEGAFCFVGTCLFGEAPPETPSYGDCGNGSPVCEEGGICLNGGVDTWTVCTPGCTEAGDCPDAPATGNPTVMCIDASSNPGNECILDCSGGEECPFGMTCNEFDICSWDILPAATGYGNCAAFPEGAACTADEACWTDMAEDPDTSVCAEPCPGGVDDCEALPGTGNNIALACGNVDGQDGDECYLDCSGGGATCPDGMVCSAADVCMWEGPPA